MQTLLIAIGSISFLYFFFALTGILRAIVRKRVCAVCAAVSFTWIGLLAGYLAGRNIDPIVLALLMGGSVVGFMYTMQGVFEKKGWRNFWFFRWGILALGIPFCWSLLNERWSLTVSLAAAGIAGGLYGLSFAKKPLPVNEATPKHPDLDRAKREFEERMKHCCE